MILFYGFLKLLYGRLILNSEHVLADLGEFTLKVSDTLAVDNTSQRVTGRSINTQERNVRVNHIIFIFHFLTNKPLNMDGKLQHTLFLWIEGMFPRRIAYALIMKGLVESPARLFTGETKDPYFQVKRIIFEGGKMINVDPTDPRPADKSMPCLRIVDLIRGTTTWLHESTAILNYLEDIYPTFSPLRGPTPLDKALMNDTITRLNEALVDSLYYIKNAAPVTTFWSGLRDEERSLDIALYAKKQMVKGLLKVQAWAEVNLQNKKWLTHGLDHPGLADLCLAAWIHYNELSYAFDILEDKELGLLRNWYARFKQESWWKELEESDYHHPPEITYDASCREV